MQYFSFQEENHTEMSHVSPPTIQQTHSGDQFTSAALSSMPIIGPMLEISML